MMKAIGDRIFITPDDATIVGNSGLFFNDSGSLEMSAPYKGTVACVSENSCFNIGDRVLFQKGIGLNILLDDYTKAIIMREDQIECIIDSHSDIRMVI